MVFARRQKNCSNWKKVRKKLHRTKKFLHFFLWTRRIKISKIFWNLLPKEGNNFPQQTKTWTLKGFHKKLFSGNCSFGHVEWSFDKLVECFSSNVLNFFTRSSKVNEKKVTNLQRKLEVSFHSECLSDKSAVFFILPTIYRQKANFFA